MKELKEDIKSKNFKRIYLFFGDENYLKNYYEGRFKNVILDKSFEMMNLDIFEGKSQSVQNIIDSAYTAPFMSERRLIIVKDSYLFITGKKDESDKLADFLKDVPISTTIIFIEDTVDKRNKLYKSASSLGIAVEFKILKEPELIKWVTDLFEKKDKLISKECVISLIRTVPDNMGTIAFEVDKLINYKSDSKEITFEDIDIVCTKSLENRIFELVKAVGEKKLEKSLDVYSNMIIMKEQPIMILTMIARQFRLILQCKDLVSQGQSSEVIASTLGIRSFIVNDCKKQASNFKFNTLLQAINECLEIDLGIKTGKLNPKLAVEIFLIKYAKD